MMKNLLYKELRLAVHPTMYMFLAMPLLMLVPNYPYYVVFMYTCLAIYFTFLIGREQNDIFYTATLPVKKIDVVKGRFATVILFELASVLISVPFAVISAKINPNGGNAAGIEPNLAFYGLALIMLGGFNMIFIPEFYRTAHKLFRPMIYAAVFICVYIGVAETFAQYWHSPISEFLDRAGIFAEHLPILAAGIIIYAALTFGAYKISAKRFGKVDL